MSVKAEYKRQIGKTIIKFTSINETEIDFFKQNQFYLNDLPSVGPNGETDIQLKFRTTKEGHEYFSAISVKAGQELQFGQSQKNPGKLYAKRWVDLYKEEGGQSTPTRAATKTEETQAPTTEAQDEADKLLGDFDVEI